MISASRRALSRIVRCCVAYRRDQPEARREPVGPLIVVEQGPVEVADERDALGHGPRHLPEMKENRWAL